MSFLKAEGLIKHLNDEKGIVTGECLRHQFVNVGYFHGYKFVAQNP